MRREEMRETSQRPEPDPALRALERLVGTWSVTGGAEGHVTYGWMQGGYFLVQHVDLQQGGFSTTGIEIIGRERRFGENASEDIRSRYYDDHGNTFDYVYELDGDTLTIWAGEKGSPALYRGTFSADGDAITGSWTYPDGGGYTSTMRRS